jgi:hypothetical protein
MRHDIETLLEFLATCGPEVLGHLHDSPADEDTAKLQRFVQGQSGPEERREIYRLMREHPAWYRWVAERTRAARPQRPATAGEAQTA